MITEPKTKSAPANDTPSYGIKNLYVKKNAVINGLVKTSIGSVALYDFENKAVLFSQWKVLKSLGYTQPDFEEVSKDFFKKITHPEDTWIVQRHIQKIRSSKSGEVLACIFRIKDASGYYRWIHIRDTVLHRNSNGDVSQVIGSVVDITRYKNLKRQIDQNIARLDSLSFRNAHELRSPVATVLGLVSLLKHESKSESYVNELIDSLETTVTKMDKVIREFGIALDTDRANLKKQTMETQQVADNRHYTLSVNLEKNRAYLKIKGFWKSKESVPHYLTDWKKTTALLKRNFTLLTDASEMKTHPQDVRRLHEEAQAHIIKSGISKIAEIVKDDIAEIQLDAMAKTTQLPKKNFSLIQDAEQWLDDHR